MGNEDSVREASHDSEHESDDLSASDMEKSDGATLIQTSSGELCVSVVLVSEAEIISNGLTPELMRNSTWKSFSTL